MTTEEILDPSQTTPSQEPPSPETLQPSQETTETVEELKEKLAAAENEASRWKGRVEKATKTKPKDTPPVSEDELDWKIANTGRVNLVKDTYQKHLEDFQELGAKVTPALRDKALMLAENELGINKVKMETSDESLPTPGVERSGSRTPRLTETDVALGVKPETISEYRDFVEGR